MDQNDWLAKHFEGARKHLKGVAYRMLGSAGEAEDAVQEAWIRLSGSDSGKIENLEGWLTTVVARVCLDMLRSRKIRREEALRGDYDVEGPGAEADLVLADSVGTALLAVLDTLNPAERIAFVLHDLFDLPFEELAPILDRTEEAARQLASRARRRVRGQRTASPADAERQREIVTAFLAASRDGNFTALLQVLHPDVVLRADETAVKVSAANRAKGAPAFEREIRGASAVAGTFKGRASAARLGLVDGAYGAFWAPAAKPVVAFVFSVRDGGIDEIEVVMNPEDLEEMRVEALGD